jgi:hypothetical protein
MFESSHITRGITATFHDTVLTHSKRRSIASKAALEGLAHQTRQIVRRFRHERLADPA